MYCDPPYENTTGYEYSIKNFGEFWLWCEKLIERDCKVFVSGYTKPLAWEVFWEKKVKTVLDKNSGSERTEKLFTKFGNKSWLEELE